MLEARLLTHTVGNCGVEVGGICLHRIYTPLLQLRSSQWGLGVVVGSFKVLI
jgi:hypothetical protein